MFQFLFKYPIPVFTKGRFVLLSAWPAWLLPVLIVAAVGRPGAADPLAICATPRPGCEAGAHGWSGRMQSATLALLLLLLWQPAMTVGELSSQQNIIAVVVDDSRSMAIADSNGSTREAAALAALNGGVLAGLQKRFQTRLYRLDRDLTRVDSTQGIAPTGPATHFDDGLKQLAGRHLRSAPRRHRAAERRQPELAGPGRLGHLRRTLCRPCAIAAFRCTRSASAREELAHDVEIEDVSVAKRRSPKRASPPRSP